MGAGGAIYSLAPEWGSAEARDAAAQLRAAPDDIRLQAKRAHVMERAAVAGLTGIHARPSDVFTAKPSASELRSLRVLRAATSQIVHESVDPARLQSALTHYERWRDEAPACIAFMPLHGPDLPGLSEAERYNSETLELFSASYLRRGSLRRGHIGDPIETDTVAGYVSALRAFLSRDGGIQMRSERHEVRIKAVNRGVRRARGLRPTRRKRLGLRARHLRAAAANRQHDRKRSWPARRRWMAAVIGHSLVARGCELGRAANKAFSTARGLRWQDIKWHAIGSLNPTHAALTVHLCAAKDGEGRGPRFPMQIRRRAVGTTAAHDALCGYDLLLAAWREDLQLLGKKGGARHAHLPQLRPGRGSVGSRDPRRVRHRTRDCTRGGRGSVRFRRSLSPHRRRLRLPRPLRRNDNRRPRGGQARPSQTRSLAQRHRVHLRAHLPRLEPRGVGTARRRQRPRRRVGIRRMGRNRDVTAHASRRRSACSVRHINVQQTFRGGKGATTEQSWCRPLGGES